MKLKLGIVTLACAVVMAPAGNKAMATLWTVNVGNFSFSPKNLTIQEGDIVKWQWTSGSHTTTSGDPCVADGIWSAPMTSANPTFQKQFNSAGSFPYFCIPHCGSNMTANLTVETPTGVFDDLSDGVPQSFAVNQNYPNPFNTSTVISYALAKEGLLTLQVYDLLGRNVATLIDEIQPVGRHQISWNGRDTEGRLVASGIYFYRLAFAQEIETRKMIMMK